MDPEEIYGQVRTHYSAASQSTNPKYGKAIAESFGYSLEELSKAPEGSNLGLSCGNPHAIAGIKEGETVIDLGSGAGFDVFLAAEKVGPTGQVIGVDMNKDMLARASKIKTDTNRSNVRFVESGITDMSVLDSGIADCIISNCVVNLVPPSDKNLVFKEMFRLLKPGGRVAISDILAKKPLPDKLRSDMALYVGCIAGASEVQEYESYLKESGFRDIVIADTHGDLNVYFQTGEDGSAMAECCIEPAGGHKSVGCCKSECKDLKQNDFNEWAGSFRIYAVKQ